MSPSPFCFRLFRLPLRVKKRQQKKLRFTAVPVKQEKIKSPDFRGEYGVTSVTPFLFASISSAE